MIAEKLATGDLSQVQIYQPQTGVGHPLLCLIKAPFEAFVDKVTCYSMLGTQQSISVAKKRPHELEIGHTTMHGFQLLIKT